MHARTFRSMTVGSATLGLIFFGATSTALATPPGTLTYTSTWYGGSWSVTGQGPTKTTASFEKSFGNPPAWNNFATRTVPPTSGRIWSLGPNDVPYYNWDVRINWGAGNVTGSTRLARLENSDNPAVVVVNAGTPSVINNFGVSFFQNTAATQAAFGTQWLTTGSAFTLTLPAGFTWSSAPTILPLGSGLGLGLPVALADTLTIPILSNAHTDPSAGFRIESSSILYNGFGSPGVPQVPMTFHFDNPAVSDYSGTGSGYCEIALFQVVPAPSTAAALSLLACSGMPRRRRAAGR